MYRWQKLYDKAIREIAKEKIVRDMGGATPFQKDLAQYKDLFVNCDYKTIDVDPKFNPDIVADIHKLPLEDESVDAIICKSVLEHVSNPVLAMAEMKRALRKGGKMFMFLPFIYPYHAGHGYKDYWRFSRDGAVLLFEGFSKVEIEPVRGFFGSLAYFLPPVTHGVVEPVTSWMENKLSRKNTASGFNIYAIK